MEHSWITKNGMDPILEEQRASLCVSEEEMKLAIAAGRSIAKSDLG